MDKITKFSDIPQFTRAGSWECNFDIEGIARWIEQEQREGLQLNPKFQRGHVWTEEQQIAFLEYFFRGGKSGLVVYFNKSARYIEIFPVRYLPSPRRRTAGMQKKLQPLSPAIPSKRKSVPCTRTGFLLHFLSRHCKPHFCSLYMHLRGK